MYKMFPSSSFPTHHWISPDVAIGDHRAAYTDFTWIVNLNYPANGASYRRIHTSTYRGKNVMRIGLADDPSEREFMTDVLALIAGLPRAKILFHCYAGISRSATCALSYLVRHDGETTLTAFLRAKNARRPVLPNVGFMEALCGFHNDYSFFKWFTLTRAVLCASPAWVEYLIDHYDPNATLEDGTTLLECACTWGSANIIRMLLERGASARGSPNRPVTPLHLYALGKPTLELIELMVYKGADLNARDEDGRTVLHYLYPMSEHADLIAQLTARGADPNVLDHFGCAPHHLASPAATIETNQSVPGPS